MPGRGCEEPPSAISRIRYKGLGRKAEVLHLWQLQTRKQVVSTDWVRGTLKLQVNEQMSWRGCPSIWKLSMSYRFDYSKTKLKSELLGLWRQSARFAKMLWNFIGIT